MDDVDELARKVVDLLGGDVGRVNEVSDLIGEYVERLEAEHRERLRLLGGDDA